MFSAILKCAWKGNERNILYSGYLEAREHRPIAVREPHVPVMQRLLRASELLVHQPQVRVEIGMKRIDLQSVLEMIENYGK